jgi:hypothetical protein
VNLGVSEDRLRGHPGNKKPELRSGFLDLAGAPVGIRTPNLLIRSQMLYPLSYGRSVPAIEAG